MPVIFNMEKCSSPAIRVLMLPEVTQVHDSLLHGEGIRGKVKGMCKTDASTRKARGVVFDSGPVNMHEDFRYWISDDNLGLRKRQADKVSISICLVGLTQDHEQ